MTTLPISDPALYLVETDRFIDLKGVRFHYVDWGGAGKPLIFLPGLGDSAHIFDELAPEFAGGFRLLGLTRRGQGLSDKPEKGYTSPELAGDIRDFMDALALPKATLVGHSLAGMEMTYFAGLFPERLDRLVYLDAAFDQSQRQNVSMEGMPNPDHTSMDSLREWVKMAMEYWSEALETNFRQVIYLGEDGAILERTSDAVGMLLLQGAMGSPLDYTLVKAPALGIFGMSEAIARILSERVDESLRPAFLETMAQLETWKREQIERFRKQVAGSRVVEVPDAGHYVYLARRDVVVREMMAFLQG